MHNRMIIKFQEKRYSTIENVRDELIQIAKSEKALFNNTHRVYSILDSFEKSLLKGHAIIETAQELLTSINTYIKESTLPPGTELQIQEFIAWIIEQGKKEDNKLHGILQIDNQQAKQTPSSSKPKQPTTAKQEEKAEGVFVTPTFYFFPIAREGTMLSKLATGVAHASLSITYPNETVYLSFGGQKTLKQDEEHYGKAIYQASFSQIMLTSIQERNIADEYLKNYDLLRNNCSQFVSSVLQIIGYTQTTSTLDVLPSHVMSKIVELEQKWVLPEYFDARQEKNNIIDLANKTFDDLGDLDTAKFISDLIAVDIKELTMTMEKSPKKSEQDIKNIALLEYIYNDTAFPKRLLGVADLKDEKLIPLQRLLDEYIQYLPDSKGFLKMLEQAITQMTAKHEPGLFQSTGPKETDALVKLLKKRTDQNVHEIFFACKKLLDSIEKDPTSKNPIIINLQKLAEEAIIYANSNIPKATPLAMKF